MSTPSSNGDGHRPLPDDAADLLRLGVEAADYVDIEDAMTTPDQETDPERLAWLDQHDDEGQLQPWGKGEHEDARAYALFQFYCSLPRASRSFARVARHYSAGPGKVQQMAKTYDWRGRVQYWDAERDRIYQTQVWEEMRAMGERHGKVLKTSIEAMTIPLEAMSQRMAADPEGVAEELGHKNITQLHAMAIKSARALPNTMAAERLARGLPTEITANVHSGKVEHVHTPDLSEVTAILDGLHKAGAIEIVGDRIIDSSEVVDAAYEPLRQDDTDAETDSLPPSQ